MSDKPKPEWWAEFERLAALPVVSPEPVADPKPKRSHRAKGIPIGEGRPLKGVLPKACYRGHLYTLETTGTRVVAGNVVRKCLVCAEERRNRVKVIAVKHGTLHAYRRHKCRCVECRRANTETRRRQRMKGEANGRFI